MGGGLTSMRAPQRCARVKGMNARLRRREAKERSSHARESQTAGALSAEFVHGCKAKVNEPLGYPRESDGLEHESCACPHESRGYRHRPTQVLPRSAVRRYECDGRAAPVA
jgi:hypothetical protein